MMGIIIFKTDSSHLLEMEDGVGSILCAMVNPLDRENWFTEASEVIFLALWLERVAGG